MATQNPRQCSTRFSVYIAVCTTYRTTPFSVTISLPNDSG